MMPASGFAVHVVDQVLVDGPGVDEPLDRVDRAVVEAVGLGLRVRDARVDPGLARATERVGVRRLEKRVDDSASARAPAERILIAGVDERRVAADDRLLERRQVRGIDPTPQPGSAMRQDQRRDDPAHGAKP